MKRRLPRCTRLVPLLVATVPSSAACAARTPPAHEAEPIVWIAHPASAPVAPRAPEPEPEPPRRARPRAEGRQPHRFWFLYLGETTERREWVRVDRSTWEERYPSGAVMRFRIVGRVREGNHAGVVVRRLPDEGLDVFIPDLGTAQWSEVRVAPDGEWHDLGAMHVIE